MNPRIIRSVSGRLVVILAAMAVSGCISPSTPPDQGAATTSSRAAAPMRSAEPLGHDDQAEPQRAPAAVAAVDAATRFATAWARPSVPASVWWSQIAPLCEPRFAEKLRTVDPARIPADRLSGPAVLQSSYTTSATFTFATPGGRLSVTVTIADGVWLASANDFTRAQP